MAKLLHPTTLLVCLYMFSSKGWARPEYALQLGINKCTACHYSATGGGPRNLNGKYFGAHGFKLNPLLAQSWVGADIKFLHYAPEKSSQVRDGTGVMASNLWASAPLLEAEDGGYSQRLMYEHNLGGFGSGQRQVYLEFAKADGDRPSWAPSHVVFGRIIPAFGLPSDEHRSYVRMQTATTWNNGLRMGTQVSGNPWDALHYDISILNGQENAGGMSTAGQSDAWGTIFNLRWLTPASPVMVGISANRYDGLSGGSPRSAQALYSGLSLSKLTTQSVPVEITAEVDVAQNWNSATWATPFVTDAYLPLVDGKNSRGASAGVEWRLNPRWTLTYRFDDLVMDTDYPGDAFQRNGVGFRAWLGPNVWLMARYDRSTAGRPDEEAGARTGSLDAGWAVLNVDL